MSQAKEIATSEHLLKFLFVELLKDYTEVVINSRLSKETISQLMLWFSKQYEQMMTTSKEQPLQEFVTTFLHAANQAFPEGFTLLHPTALLSVRYANPEHFLENIYRATLADEKVPDDYLEQTTELVPVIAAAIGNYLTSVKNSTKA